MISTSKARLDPRFEGLPFSSPGILLGHWELAARIGGAELDRLLGRRDNAAPEGSGRWRRDSAGTGGSYPVVGGSLWRI